MTPRSQSAGPAPALRPVARSRLFEAVAERLLSHIVQEDLRSGDQLPGERELVRRLGVSRSSVRQAILTLQTQGVLDVRHGDGTFLRHLDTEAPAVASVLRRRDRLPEVLDARRALEVPIAGHAAERRTAADLRAIDAGLTRMRDQVEAGEVGLGGDGDFHHAITLAAHNSLLAELMEHLAEAIAETRSESLAQPGRPRQSLRDHERIAERVRAQDAGGARAAMNAHLDHVAELRLFQWNPGT
jgi:GntR family transcriptional regulator, transcriptional repressor for pyruvate dehydrogenase complex